MDYGLVIRMRNPYAGGNEVLILAGCWGYGTAGAADLLHDKQFLANPVIKSQKEFEAVVRADVCRGALQSVELVDIRELIGSTSA